jgi:hypothetical protein
MDIRPIWLSVGVAAAAAVLCACSERESNGSSAESTVPAGDSISPATGNASSNDDVSAEPDASHVPPTDSSWLRDRYPGDEGLAADPAVLFFDDFEAGWGRWDAPQADSNHLFVEQGDAHSGSRLLRSTVTEAQLDEEQYISASPRIGIERTDAVFARLHVRFPVLAPNPHHWMRFSAGTDGFSSSGLANTVPDGDQGFWFDFDATTDDRFNFYAYWYGMRSGRCNDGSATDGCAGDQGTTYYYGNVFQPRDQQPFPRDRWFCLEIEAHANTLGRSDGSLHFYLDDELVGAYGPGYPEGTWLRSSFHEGGCEFSACTPPGPFEGLQLRTHAAVQFKEFFLDAYYERDSSANRRAEMEANGLTVSGEQTILYDDIVVAKERIGCRL